MLMRSEDFDGKISIITAAYNAENHIHHLIESLRQQIDPNFEWVVVDGLSTDNTLEILKQVNDLNIKIISEADFGIYDALNKGVKACSGEFYLVAGADDTLNANAIKDYKAAIEPDIDMITASVLMGECVMKPRGHPWLYGQAAFISNHALGVLIRKQLHITYGYYSKKFPIAADQLFIKLCCQGGVKVKYINILIGEFGTTGVSSEDKMGVCTEFFRVQLLTNENKWVQYILLVIKLTLRMFR